MDPMERLDRLGALGIETVVVEHFDDTLRRTPYERFVAGIQARCRLDGFVMTPDAAFGHERGGTPAALAELGRREGFDVVLVPPFTLEGREVRSSEIRAAIAAGDLGSAAALLGRPYAVRGQIDEGGTLSFPMPVTLPPPGRYRAVDGDRTGEIVVSGDGSLAAAGEVARRGPARVAILSSAEPA
jgi:FAD synthase